MINEEIRDSELRLIGPDGAQLGIMSAREAQKIATEQGLDLVKIAPPAKPPVCKIMDYGKFCFEEAKREKEARKNQRTMDIKEVRFSPSIDEHDFQTKLKNAIKFLKAGDKVKATVRFRGREVAYAAIGMQLLERVEQEVAEFGTVEKKPKLDGKNMTMVITPKQS